MKRIAPLSRFLLGAGIFLFVVGAKLWVVSVAGSSVPYRDQIDAEGESILRPWLEDRLEWQEFFAPHNEHRIVFTKVIALASVAMNGQWDAYLQVTLNALIHAVLLLVVLGWFRQHLGGWRLTVITVTSILLWVVPFDWENTLQGFQSQVYLVLGLSFSQILLVLGAERVNWKWSIGHLCGFLALGAMAGGAFSSAAIILVVAVRSWKTRKLSRFSIATAGIATLWLIIGLTTHTSVPGHEMSRAQTLAEAITAFSEILAWPTRGYLPAGVLFGLPAIVASLILLRRQEITLFQQTFVGVVIWILITAFAMAVFRGHSSPLISRYLTNYTFLVIAQGLAWTIFGNGRWSNLGLIAWGVVVAISLLSVFDKTWERTIKPTEQRIERQEVLVRKFLANGDARVLTRADIRDLPYPSAAVLNDRWGHDVIQQIMPAAVRAPLKIDGDKSPVPTEIPLSLYPVMAASPAGSQTESWMWRSKRYSAETLRFLRFRINGGLGDPESALTMRLVSDSSVVEVIPEGSARNRWKTINVLRPPGEWWIELEDNDNLEHIALTSPVELGVISWAVEKAIKYHLWWMSLSGVLLLGALVTTILPSRLRTIISPNNE